MPILTNSQGRKLYVLRRISTGEILKRNTLYPAAQDDAPLEGFDSDLEYLAIDQDVIPDYDARLYTLGQTEAKTQDGKWKVAYATSKRPSTEIKAAAANAEAEQNRRQYTDQERDKVIILGLGVLFRLQANQNLTAKEVALKNRIIAMATTLWKNDARLSAIIAAIDANSEPDLDAGWEPAP